ncbi:MAG: M28 family peptidase [Candidatus Hermodarchaeota archaeon]
MIDEKRIVQNLKDFSFPRLSGTEFEKKSFNLVKKKIEELQLTPKIQEFTYSTFYSRIYPKISLTVLSWLLIVLFLNIQVIFTILNLVLILLLILILIKFTRNPEKIKIGRIYHSQNIFLKISAQSNKINSDQNIFLFSHLDSKGQALSIKFRIMLYYIWIISFPFSLFFIIFDSFVFCHALFLVYIFAVLFLIINCFATLIIALNTTNNVSSGTIDNASGISCVLELVLFYSNPENQLQNYNLWFVFTGAEESGTMGIRNFYNIIREYNRDKTFIINFDSIAKRVYLWDHGLINKKNFKAQNYILENNDIMSLEKAKKIYFGMYSDGLFLLNKKFQGLGNGDKSAYKYIHSVNDNIDKVDTTILKKLCHFYTILLKDIDK